MLRPRHPFSWRGRGAGVTVTLLNERGASREAALDADVAPMRRERRAAIALLIGALATGVALAPVRAEDASGRWLPARPLSDVSALASHDEIVRRVMSPVAYDVARAYGQGAGLDLRGQSLKPAGEQVDLYVPAQRPARGYGLLVFVAPTRDLALPMAWRRVLAERGVILAAPRNAGNGSHGIGRRIPLALLAYEHVRARYPLDETRVYVGGFSGGSRIALTVALGYADVFRGAFLVAGSAEIGGRGPTPPPAPIMELAQARTRLVFVTGQRDRGALDRDRFSERALREYCITHMSEFVQRSRGHQLPAGKGLADGLRFLDAPAADWPGLEACRSALRAQADSALEAARQLAADGLATEAGHALTALDRRFGGLAAPRSVELARCLLQPTGCARQ